MNLVLVFLTNVREYIIVPENYIYGLDINAVKNLGKNSCRNYLIYWSDDCVEGAYYPEPDENAAKSTQFPAERGAWFFGRIIYFTGISQCFI